MALSNSRWDPGGRIAATRSTCPHGDPTPLDGDPTPLACPVAGSDGLSAGGRENSPHRQSTPRGSGRPCCPPGILSLAPSWVLGAGGLDHMAPQTMPEAPRGRGLCTLAWPAQGRPGLSPQASGLQRQGCTASRRRGGVGSPAAVTRDPGAHPTCVLTGVTQGAARGEAGEARGAGPLRRASQAPPCCPQAKLPNLKEVDVRYTEAW